MTDSKPIRLVQTIEIVSHQLKSFPAGSNRFNPSQTHSDWFLTDKPTQTGSDHLQPVETG